MDLTNRSFRVLSAMQKVPRTIIRPKLLPARIKTFRHKKYFVEPLKKWMSMHRLSNTRCDIARFTPSEKPLREIECEASHLVQVFCEEKNKEFSGFYIFNIDDYLEHNGIMLAQQIRMPEVSHVDGEVCCYLDSHSHSYIMTPPGKSNLRSFYIASQIAHVLYHIPGYVMEHRLPTAFVRDGTPDRCFEQARHFAMSLLLPLELVASVRADKGGIESGIARMSAERSIHPSLIKRRMTELTLA